MNRTALLTISLSMALTACGGGGGSGDEQPTTTTTEETSKPVLNWVAPSTRTDDTALNLSEISGYKIYSGPSSTNLELIAEIADSDATSYDLSGIESGEYYFGIVVYDIYGLHSKISNRIVKNIP
ncbi:MAG: hypothetical protein P8101_01610 [Candidatus Thiodiazotropha sp.]|jgi:hypothetical protein